MSGRAVRSRLLELRGLRIAAQRGREVLEQKLELLRRELQKRTAERDARRAEATRSLVEARGAAREACIELGREVFEAAALAQPAAPDVAWIPARAAGVPIVRLEMAASPFRPRYGPGGTAASLDDAGARFTALLPQMVALAACEATVTSVRRGLQRTARRLNALEKAILPALERELRELASALEEEEREESIRRNSWLAQLKESSGAHAV